MAWPMIIAAIGAVVIQGATAVAAWLNDKDASEEERRNRALALREYSAIATPEHREIIAQGVKESAFSRVRGDQRLQAQQDELQSRLMARGRGEQSMASRAAQEEARMAAARTAQGDREAILAEGRARGTVGSGEELLLQQDANQAAAETERLAGMRALADADEQALQALIAGGSLAGQREERDLQRQSQEAQALDDIAVFNAGQTNSLAVANAQLRSDAFRNQLALADSRARVYQQNAASERANADRSNQALGGIGQAAGYGLAAAGQYMGGNASGAGGAAGAKKPATTQPAVMPQRRTATGLETRAPATIGPNAALPQKTRRYR